MGGLAPIDDIARTYTEEYRSKKNVFEHLSYGSTYGNDQFKRSSGKLLKYN